MAMQSFGAGRRTIAMLSAMMALAIAGQSPAAERRAAKDESASAVIKPGSRVTNRPFTGSVSSRTGDFALANASIEPYPNISDPTVPTDDEALLVDLVNIERSTRGLKPVRWDPMLTRLARLHCDDMRATKKSSHNSSKDGADYTTRLARTPYRARSAAENVAFNNTVVRAHRALMKSPGHRRNILDPELTALGTSILPEDGSGWLYVVEDFATPIEHISDNDAQKKMRESLVRAHSSIRSLPEDKSLSKKLDGMLDQMIKTGRVHRVNVEGEGQGWALAFTSLDPATPPKSAIEHAGKAESYALAVQFRKTPRYPFGAYWAVLFLKGEY